MAHYEYEAGVYELDGETRSRRSRHMTAEAAERAARRYLRRKMSGGVTAHGAGARDSWWRRVGEPVVRLEVAGS